MSKCPLCKLDIKATGRFVAVADESNQHFVFAICMKCNDRHRRLPAKTAQRQINISLKNIAKNPESYRVMQFPDAYSARIFAKLETENMAAQLIQQIPQYVFSKSAEDYRYQMSCEEIVCCEEPVWSIETLDSAGFGSFDPT